MFSVKIHKKTLNQCVMILIMAIIAGLAHASFHKSLWPKWEVNNPLSTETISHQAWQNFLDKHVITNEEHINLIDYAHLTQQDLNLLKNYVKAMSQIDIDNYNRQEQLAYWINLYNALTVQTVANYYPIANIQEINISPGLFSVGPWGANLLTIKDTTLSLDDINNRIIRPVWNDPRTHYALNNATIGAPNLSKQAYQGVRLEQQLNDAASTYINSLRGVQVIEGKLIISKLYDWYEEDYGGTKQDVIRHLLQFAHEPLLSQLKHINTIDSYVYNWHLNYPASQTS
ncbi:putative Ser/Thr protein kinase [Legionella quateirensis]|uniref:Ser/Thr protein kinase n=2 Tax=Legionella quateirensis TaxID=45072 RepID=A0A378KXF0_9GAMM|nr:putative Ser/Thr protein kinase [Legionella quateirensis]STY19252.1 putative Ser/Thr protein kinase [Legionella quateirensis]